MNVFDRALSVFYTNNDGDLSADVAFRWSFVNVVNTFLLLYSLMMGFYSLYHELLILAMVNMLFSVAFVSYFVITYLVRRSLFVSAMNRFAIFLYFIAIFINGNFLGFGGIVMVIYPFIAIIIHGRRLGVVLSLSHLPLIAFVCFLFHSGVFPTHHYFSAFEVSIIAAMQAVCTFIYYVAIRWMSNIIYDHIRENYQIQELLKTKSDLVDMLTKHMRSSIEDINAEAQQLEQDLIEARFVDHVGIIRASAKNLLAQVDSVQQASQYNIRPIKQENVVFNVYNLAANTLKLYPTKRREDRHSVVISPELPQRLEGNSLVLRQVLLCVLDALNRKIDLSENPVTILVSLCDIVQNGLSINFNISTSTAINLDHRDLSSHEARLVETFDLDMSRRIVMASGGDFHVNLDKGQLSVDFSLEYRDADARPVLDPELVSAQLHNMNEQRTTVVPIDQATVMIVDDNEINIRIIEMFIADKVKRVIKATDGYQAIKLFENNRTDIVLMDIQMPGMDGFATTMKMRSMEQGSGRHIPIIAVTAYDFPENEQRCAEVGMSGYIRKPFKAEELWAVMGQRLQD